MSDIIKIYIDEGCKRNGGTDPQAYGSLAVEYQGEIKRRMTQDFPQVKTSNQAEYGALLMAMSYVDNLKARAQNILPPIEILTDSQLVYEQLTGQFKVKAANLKKLHAVARDWMQHDPSVTLEKVERSVFEAVLGH
jgi:ribonuclease HI